MARVLFILGLTLTALILQEDARTNAYDVTFSNDTTSDFTKGNFDVSSFLLQDWLTLPILGFCTLAGKFTTPHPIRDTSLVRGTLYTTFEYLTSECTAESNRNSNSCALLTSMFKACLPFTFDRRTSFRPWGYCTNFNFRVSYLWVPISVSNTLTTSLDNWEVPPVCSGVGCVTSSLGTIHKDMAVLKKLVRSSEEGCAASLGRLDTGCDWRYSNLVPVAWDGVQNVLVTGDSLQSADSRYALVMQTDCNLVLYRRGPDGKYEWNALWAAYSQFNDPFSYNCTTELRPNGNLIVRDPSGKARWQSGGLTSLLYTSALTVTRKGVVIVSEMTSGTTLWSSS